MLKPEPVYVRFQRFLHSSAKPKGKEKRFSNEVMLPLAVVHHITSETGGMHLYLPLGVDSLVFLRVSSQLIITIHAPDH